MPRRAVPTGEERQALFDELSTVFTRCSKQASALDAEQDAALRAIPAAALALTRRDAAVREAERKADAAGSRADRAVADAIQAADREFFEAAQAADAKRQQAAIDADRARDIDIREATQLFEDTVRAIHNATAGLQAIADAEKRARDERDQTIRDAEHDFRVAIEKADSARQMALDTAASRQITAHADANRARSDAVREARSALDNTTADADRVMAEALDNLPAALTVISNFSRRRAALQAACDAEKRAIEARLRGEG